MNQYLLFKLKPLCDDILRNPTLENAKKFAQELEVSCKQPKLFPSGASDLILCPILMQVGQLNVRNGNEIKVHLVNSIANLLRCLKVTTLISFKTILIVMLKEIYVDDSSVVQPNLSEELKLSIVLCLETATRYISSDIIEQFYVVENRIIIARILLVCVKLISTEKNKSLRIAAINCILSTKQIHDAADLADIVIRDQVADIVFLMLPKVVATLKNVALGDEKQGQAIIVLSIKALGRILQLILEDGVRDDYYPSNVDLKALVDNIDLGSSSDDSNVLKIKLNGTTEKEKLEFIDGKKRNKEWLQAASRKMLPVIQSFNRLIGHKNPKIRKELERFAVSLLQTCSKNMSSCVTALLEIQIAVGEVDGEPLNAKYTFDDKIVDVIEQIFLSHLTKLPRIIYTGDEEEQLAGLNLLNGLVKALTQTDNIKICLTNEQVLNRLITALLATVELDRPNQLLDEQHSIRLIDETVDDYALLGTATPWKSFKNLRNQATAWKIKSVCQLLGRNRFARELVLDSLLKLFCANSSNCNEILVLFQYFIPDKGQENAKLGSLDEAVLEEILTYTHWSLGLQAISANNYEKEELGDSQWYEDRTEGLYESAITIRTADIKWKQNAHSSSDNETLTLNDVKFNVLHTCLILETVATYASFMGDDFQPYLLNSIHQILEKSGSSHYMIHSAGIYVLSKLKMALNLKTISELIFRNSDYISFHVNKSLRKADESKSALDILSVVIKYSSFDTIPHLESIITTVLTESSKTYQQRNIISFLKVFHMILLGVNEWTKQNVNGNDGSKEVDRAPNESTHKNWLHFLRHEVNFDDVEEEIKESLDVENDEPLDMADKAVDTTENEETTKLQPIYVKFTINILKRCIRYVSSKNRDEKLVALDAICVGLNVIKFYENDLLPMVHSIWNPFVERVRDNDPIILRRCFSLLHILALYAKDFIYHRTAKEILPYIVKFLKQHSKHIHRNQNGNSYDLTQEFKLQRELFLSLPDILICINISEKDLNEILDVSLPYLSTKKHPILQQHCIEFWLKMSRFDKAAIWVKNLKLKNDPQFNTNVAKIMSQLL